MRNKTIIISGCLFAAALSVGYFFGSNHWPQFSRETSVGEILNFIATLTIAGVIFMLEANNQTRNKDKEILLLMWDGFEEDLIKLRIKIETLVVKKNSFSQNEARILISTLKSVSKNLTDLLKFFSPTNKNTSLKVTKEIQELDTMLKNCQQNLWEELSGNMPVQKNRITADQQSNLENIFRRYLFTIRKFKMAVNHS